MKRQKPTPKIEDIELVPDAWDRFVRAVKQVAKHPPIEHSTGYGKLGKSDSKPKRRNHSR